MSVLNSIKTKLSTKKLDFPKSVVLPFWSTKPQEDKPDAEAEAGFAMLSLYQGYWSDIHRASEANASRAQEVDNIIAGIAMDVGQQVLTVNHFLAEMTKFTEIQSQIDAATDRIAGLGTSCSELEDKLVLLEDVCNEMQQNNNKFEHEYQLRKYRERKHLELEQVKANVAKQHASRIQQFEQRMRAQLKERQKVFEAAFTEQMANYRALGRIPDDSVVVATATASGKDLSDITIDDDNSLLDKFLTSSTELTADETHGVEGGASGSSTTATGDTRDRLDCSQIATGDRTDRLDCLQTAVDDEAYVLVNKTESD